MTSKLVKEAKKSSFKKSVLMGLIDERVNELASEIKSINFEAFKQGELSFRVVLIGSLAEMTGNAKLSAACVEWMEIINA